MTSQAPPGPSASLRERCFSGGLYRLLAWLSPGFPTGAFSFSHGLEAAVENGKVRDRASLQDWIRTVVASGGGRIDADVLSAAHRAAAAGDIEAVEAANRRGDALPGSAEAPLPAHAPGRRLLAT